MSIFLFLRSLCRFSKTGRGGSESPPPPTRMGRCRSDYILSRDTVRHIDFYCHIFYSIFTLFLFIFFITSAHRFSVYSDGRTRKRRKTFRRQNEFVGSSRTSKVQTSSSCLQKRHASRRGDYIDLYMPYHSRQTIWHIYGHEQMGIVHLGPKGYRALTMP